MITRDEFFVPQYFLLYKYCHIYVNISLDISREFEYNKIKL